MKRVIFVILLTVAVSSFVACGSEKEVMTEVKEYCESEVATEDKEQVISVQSADKTVASMTVDEIEDLINQKVEERTAQIEEQFDEKLAEIASNSGKDGRDGKDGAPGRDGKDGVGVAGVTVDANGDLIVALTNGVIANVGHVKGEKGDTGERGERGEKGDDGEDAKHSDDSSAGKAAEDAARAAAEAAARATEELIQQQQDAEDDGAAMGTVIHCTDGACAVSLSQLQIIHATWDFAGDAIEMAGHHSISELEAVVGPVTRL